MQTYEQAYHCTFRSVHQRNAALHVPTYALLPSDRFLRTLTTTPGLSQDGWTLNLDDTQIQVFHQLQRKLPDILKAVKAVITARKKGRGKSGEAGNGDEVDAK